MPPLGAPILWRCLSLLEFSCFKGGLEHVRVKISGEIPLIQKITLKITQIDGRIPSISLKSPKIGHFSLLNGKISAYIPLIGCDSTP
jgi:hypothetical protein